MSAQLRGGRIERNERDLLRARHLGAPVFELADRIYRSHLFNCTRAIWRREGREVPSGELDD